MSNVAQSFYAVQHQYTSLSLDAPGPLVGYYAGEKDGLEIAYDPSQALRFPEKHSADIVTCQLNNKAKHTLVMDGMDNWETVMVEISETGEATVRPLKGPARLNQPH